MCSTMEVRRCLRSWRPNIVLHEKPAHGTRKPAFGRDERELEVGGSGRDEGVSEPRHHAPGDEPRRAMCNSEARLHQTDVGRAQESVDDRDRGRAEPGRAHE